MRFNRLFISLSAFFLLLFAGTAYTGCVKDNCVGANCLNGASCVDGFCSCPVGYSGPVCDTVWSTKFLGVWHNYEVVTDSAGKDTSYYVIHVRPYYAEGTNIGGAWLVDSLEQHVDSVGANVALFRTFTFSDQYHNDSTFHLLSGSGSISGDSMVLATFSFTDHHHSKTSTMIWTR